MIRGIGTSKGIGMGRALIVESPQMEIFVKKSKIRRQSRNVIKRQRRSLLKKHSR